MSFLSDVFCRNSGHYWIKKLCDRSFRSKEYDACDIKKHFNMILRVEGEFLLKRVDGHTLEYIYECLPILIEAKEFVTAKKMAVILSGATTDSCPLSTMAGVAPEAFLLEVIEDPEFKICDATLIALTKLPDDVSAVPVLRCIEKGMEVNHCALLTSARSIRPLDIAVRQKDVDVLKTLLKKGAAFPDILMWHKIFQMMEKGWDVGAAALIEYFPRNRVNASRDKDGCTLLHHAARLGQVQSFEALLKAGGKLTIQEKSGYDVEDLVYVYQDYNIRDTSRQGMALHKDRQKIYTICKVYLEDQKQSVDVPPRHMGIRGKR